MASLDTQMEKLQVGAIDSWKKRRSGMNELYIFQHDGDPPGVEEGGGVNKQQQTWFKANLEESSVIRLERSAKSGHILR